MKPKLARPGRGGRNDDPVSAKVAESIVLHSELDGPIGDLDEINRSLLFAEISMISYLVEGEVRILAGRLGFHSVQYLDLEGAQSYILESDTDRVVVCRGTEPNEWNDVQADANAFTDLAETVGRVHRGFKREVDVIWPDIRKVLIADSGTEDTLTLWFCGHSLGGAMATICASRCELADIRSHPAQCYTFGSPRVGTKSYIASLEVSNIRWVNNNDVVTRVPPTWLGYRHTGSLRYLNAFGNLRRLTPKQRTKDRWRGFKAGLKQRKFDHFSDHGIANYVAYIAQNVPTIR